MKKPFYVTALSALLLAACGGEETKSPSPEVKEEVTTNENNTTENNEEKEYNVGTVNVAAAQDTNIPFADRLAKVALELYSDKTVDGKERNITVDSMGEMYYLNMMFDDAITKKGTVNTLNRQTVELFKVLQQVDDYETIQVTWQANTSNGELTRVLTVTAKKTEIDAIDFESFDASKLKEHVTNYGLHKDLK